MIRSNMITGGSGQYSVIECNATGAGITLDDDYSAVMVVGTWINSSAYSPSSASITLNGVSVGTLDEVKIGGSGNHNSITFAHILENLHSGDVITPSGGVGITASASFFGIK